MNSSNRGWLRALTIAAAFAAGGASAQSAAPQPASPHKELSAPETAYQAGSSPLGAVEMYQDINPKAPSVSPAALRVAGM